MVEVRLPRVSLPEELRQDEVLHLSEDRGEVKAGVGDLQNHTQDIIPPRNVKLEVEHLQNGSLALEDIVLDLLNGILEVIFVARAVN